MGHMTTVYELTNNLPNPATDDALVEALLEFANGRDVVIWGQPDPLERVSTWSIWRTQPSAEERSAHVAFLQDLIRDPWGGLGHNTDRTGRRRPANAVIQIGDLGPARGDRAVSPRPDFNAWLAHMKKSMERELVLVGRSHGYSLADFRSFRNIASALAFATLLVMDQSKPYSKDLSRCKLRTCQRFYLAQKNPKGGGKNRTYCSPEHRQEHHDSADRKAAARGRKV
jgi:hypothetical protein